MEQRTDIWFNQRGGRFTASVIHELLSDGTRPMTESELEQFKKDNPKSKRTTTDCFGDLFYTRCSKLANERFFGVDTSWNVESWDMKRGTETEPEAFELLASLMRTGKVFQGEIVQLKKCKFIPYGDNAGASPDGKCFKKQAVAEIKCPRPEKVFELIKQNSVEAIDKKHIAQMQMQMLCTNSNRCVYFVYCVYKEKPVYHWIIVDRDEAMIDKIKTRIELGETEVQKELEMLKANIKFEY